MRKDDIITPLSISRKVTIIEAAKKVKKCVRETFNEHDLKVTKTNVRKYLGDYPEVIQIFGYEGKQKDNPFYFDSISLSTPRGAKKLREHIKQQIGVIKEVNNSTFSYGGTGLNILISNLFLLSRYKNSCGTIVPRDRLFRRKPFIPRWVGGSPVYDISKKISQLTWTWGKCENEEIRILKVAGGYKAQFNRCLRDQSVRFIFSFVFIDYFYGWGRSSGWTDSAHINALIYDKRTKRLYIFEPHGKRTIYYKHLDLYLSIEKYFEENFGIDKLLRPHISCPIRLQVGGVSIKGDPRGYCAAWSTFMIEQILKYGDRFDVERILYNSEMTREFIRSYAEFLMDERRKIIGNYREKDLNDPDIRKKVEVRLLAEIQKYTEDNEQKSIVKCSTQSN